MSMKSQRRPTVPPKPARLSSLTSTLSSGSGGNVGTKQDYNARNSIKTLKVMQHYEEGKLNSETKETVSNWSNSGVAFSTSPTNSPTTPTSTTMIISEATLEQSINENSNEQLPNRLTQEFLKSQSPPLPLSLPPPSSSSLSLSLSSLSPPTGRQARALYEFEGEASYRELSFRAGDVLTITKEKLAEGWSLAYKDGVTGLVPESYITYIHEFTELPNARLAKTSSYQPDPLPSPLSQSQAQLLTPTTPRGFTYSKSLLKGRQLNRFSWFVTTGVEEFILKGGIVGSSESNNVAIKDLKMDTLHENDEDEDQIMESDKHYIQNGPSWQEKSPIFTIMVHNPEKRVKLGGMQEFTIFKVTSLFAEAAQVTVERRYSQFEWLYDKLTAKFGPLVMSPLPEKQYSGRFNEEFVEKRRRALERFINRLARHPVIRYSDLLTHFLSCENESEWQKREKEFDADKIIGQVFFEHVYHPEFNFDDSDIENFERFEAHARGMEKLMPWVNEGLQSHKDLMGDTHRQYRRMGYALLRLITGHNVGDGYECINEEGAWCWRDDCQNCLNLTKAMQFTAESMQTIADLFESYANDECITMMEKFKEYTYPVNNYEPLIDTHMGTNKMYKEVSSSNDDIQKVEDVESEIIRSRCDTVFNVTLAEMDRIHDERAQDFQENTKTFLDGQIQLYEKILEELRQARANFDDPYYSSLSQTPFTPSKYEALIDEQRPVISRPVSVASVGSMSSMVGGVVDGVGTMGSFLLKKTGRNTSSRSNPSMFDIWWGRG